jgi:hypothetical protein
VSNLLGQVWLRNLECLLNNKRLKLGLFSIVAYVRKPFANTGELQQTIENVCDEIRGHPDFLDKLSSASRAFRHRLERCIAIGGRQVESGRYWSTDNHRCQWKLVANVIPVYSGLITHDVTKPGPTNLTHVNNNNILILHWCWGSNKKVI